MIIIAAYWALSLSDLWQRSWQPNHSFLQIVQETSWLDGILPSIHLLHNLASARFFQVPGNAEPLFLAKVLCNGVTAIIFPRTVTEKTEGTPRPAQARIEHNSSVQQEFGKGTLPPSSLPRRGWEQENSIRQNGIPVHQPLPGLRDWSTARSPPPQRRGPAATDPLQTARGPASPESRPGPGWARSVAGVAVVRGRIEARPRPRPLAWR